MEGEQFFITQDQGNKIPNEGGGATFLFWGREFHSGKKTLRR